MATAPRCFVLGRVKVVVVQEARPAFGADVVVRQTSPFLRSDGDHPAVDQGPTAVSARFWLGFTHGSSLTGRRRTCRSPGGSLERPEVPMPGRSLNGSARRTAL